MFLNITHGYAIERNRTDPLISLIEKAAQEFYAAAAPGAWFVDLLPWRMFLSFCDNTIGLDQSL
jgi:hypothetical protein